MKAVAICGSPRMGGGTERLLKTVLERLKKKGAPRQNLWVHSGMGSFPRV